MSNPTTPFGWQMPTNTDLVTDLPADFEVFGQAVATSMADLLGGTTGQVLKKNTNADMDFVWSSDNAGMTNPMTTTGDTIYSSSGSTPARLGIGTTGQVLTVAAGLPSWATPAGIPVGAIIFYGANSAPTGFLKSNGAAISRSTYASLFSAIGTTFGVGDGSTTFNVPDMRGYFARGWVDDGSIDSGRAFGSTQTASSLAYNRSGASNFPISGGQDFDSTFNGSGGSGTSGNIETLQFGRVRPYNVAFLACIKY